MGDVAVKKRNAFFCVRGVGDGLIHLTFESYDCTLWQFLFLKDLSQGSLRRATGERIRRHHRFEKQSKTIKRMGLTPSLTPPDFFWL